MMGIGEFARLSRLSPKALRRYDELDLLPPSRVDPSTGYRWYAEDQLAQARLVAELRQIGMPLAQIKAALPLGAAARTHRVEDWWTGEEADFAARRDLARFLIDRFNGKGSAVYDIKVRSVPSRNVLSLLRYVHWDEYPEVSRKFFGAMSGVPKLDGPDGAPFVVFHGEVTQDSDGPVEWCLPVPASASAADFPGAVLPDTVLPDTVLPDTVLRDTVLRTEPAHEEAYVRLARDGARTPPAQSLLVYEALLAWAVEQHRGSAGSVRQVFTGPRPVVPGPGFECDFAMPLAAAAPAPPVTGWAAADGCQLHYERRGEGPALLLIAGGGDDGSYYSAMADALAGSYTVVSYDRRGNSRSAFSGPGLMSVSQQADDALAVLGACGLSSAVVFGNSGGATIALDLAARHPSAFPVVVAHEPPLPGLLPDGSLLRQYEEILSVLDAEGWRTAFICFVTRMAGLSAEQAEFLAGQSPNWEHMMTREMRPFLEYRPDFAAIRAGGSRVVLAAGTEPDPAFRQMAEAAAAALGTDVAGFPGGHNGPMDSPDTFAARLHEVLAELAG
jgi:pimeloyl-ACP methyl ester carboxylesterase/DNA-binding transcriptional MerR regulator